MEGDVAGLGDFFGGVADVGGLVGFASEGNGREVGGIGFEEDAVFGDAGGDVEEVGAVFEGDDAGEGDVEALFDGLFGELRGAGEAVDDAGGAVFFADEAHGVFVGVAAMDDDGFLVLVGHL